MAIPGRFQAMAAGRLLLGLTWLSWVARCSALPLHTSGDAHGRVLTGDAPASAVKVFDVTTYGAKAGGQTDNVQAFMKAWVAACHAGVPAKLVFPAGTFLTGPLVFAGPCNGSQPMTVEIQGTLQATTDISEYSSPEWILFESIDGLRVTGGGTLDGQGQEIWEYNDCKKSSHCALPPASVKFSKVKNGVIERISFLNSKGFHMFVVYCQNFRAVDLKITAPGDSPNTDGVHISQSDVVNITSSVIGTGDDCISIGHGSTNIKVAGVTCGPGHGISVGSLGKYKDEKDVSGVFVTNCTLRNTTNGARIKTWPGSPPSQASHIIFQDLLLHSVKNPIVIDQSYGSKKAQPSQVKISDVHFKNIRGTTVSDLAVSLQCSSKVPCEGVELEDIDLAFTGARLKLPTLSTSCLNANIKAIGKQIPPACH